MDIKVTFEFKTKNGTVSHSFIESCSDRIAAKRRTAYTFFTARQGLIGDICGKYNEHFNRMSYVLGELKDKESFSNRDVQIKLREHVKITRYQYDKMAMSFLGNGIILGLIKRVGKGQYTLTDYGKEFVSLKEDFENAD